MLPDYTIDCQNLCRPLAFYQLHPEGLEPPSAARRAGNASYTTDRTFTEKTKVPPLGIEPSTYRKIAGLQPAPGPYGTTTANSHYSVVKDLTGTCPPHPFCTTVLVGCQAPKNAEGRYRDWPLPSEYAARRNMSSGALPLQFILQRIAGDGG